MISTGKCAYGDGIDGVDQSQNNMFEDERWRASRSLRKYTRYMTLVGSFSFKITGDKFVRFEPHNLEIILRWQGTSSKSLCRNEASSWRDHGHSCPKINMDYYVPE